MQALEEEQDLRSALVAETVSVVHILARDTFQRTLAESTNLVPQRDQRDPRATTATVAAQAAAPSSKKEASEKGSDKAGRGGKKKGASSGKRKTKGGGRSVAQKFRESFGLAPPAPNTTVEDAGDDEDATGALSPEEAAGLGPSWSYSSIPNLRLKSLRQMAKLGRGAYGVVYKVEDKNNPGTEYALKSLAKPKAEATAAGRGMHKLLRERDAQVLCSSHPNVTALYATFEDPKSMFILMELNTGKELFDLLYRPSTNPLSDAYSRFLVRPACLALSLPRPNH